MAKKRNDGIAYTAGVSVTAADDTEVATHHAFSVNTSGRIDLRFASGGTAVEFTAVAGVMYPVRVYSFELSNIVATGIIIWS